MIACTTHGARSRTASRLRGLSLGLASLALSLAVQPAHAAQDWQDDFDTVPTSIATSNTTVQSLTLPDSRTLPYGTFGPSNGEPVLFIGGTPSGEVATAFLEAHRSSVEQEGLRMIVPGRPGNGVMASDFDATISSQVDDWIYLMDQLGHEHFAVFAASGGGPFADNLLTRYPDRVTVAGIANALRSGPDSATLPARFPGICSVPAPQFLVGAFLPIFQFLAANPQFYFPPGRMTDIAQSMPGWPDLAVVQHDAYTVLTQNSDEGLALEFFLLCNEDPAGYDFAAALMPVYLYSAANDTNVLQADMDWRESVYPTVTHRRYDNDTHIAWLRHFGQVLMDLNGRGNRTLLCKDGNEKEMPSHAASIAIWLANNEATLDICPWVGTAGE